jgi:amylovoran biosynthesis glycosyltransferase AmsE
MQKPLKKSYPKFSVLMSLYHAEKPKFLEASLKSLTQSTVPIPEIILMIDGWIHPDLKDIVEKYKKKLPIRTISFKRNFGLAKALNFGLHECQYPYVARFDTDDLIDPHRFELQIKVFHEDPNLVVLGSNIRELDFKEGVFRRVPESFLQIKKFALLRNPLNHPSVMFKKEPILQIGGYPHLRFFEDFGLWVKCIMHNYKINNLALPLVSMRGGQGQVDRRYGWLYVVHEYRCARYFKKLDFFSRIDFLKFIFYRAPLRVIPKSWLTLIYLKNLRDLILKDDLNFSDNDRDIEP